MAVLEITQSALMFGQNVESPLILGFRCVPNHTVGAQILDFGQSDHQCTLTVSNSWLQALAIAASRLSVSMIGVPSAACSA